MAFEQVLLNLANGVPRHRKKFIIALLGGLLAAYYYKRKSVKLQKECPPAKKSEDHHAIKDGSKVGVNLAFVQQLKKIIPICIPGKECVMGNLMDYLMSNCRNGFKRIRIISGIGADFDYENRFGYLVHCL